MLIAYLYPTSVLPIQPTMPVTAACNCCQTAHNTLCRLVLPIQPTVPIGTAFHCCQNAHTANTPCQACLLPMSGAAHQPAHCVHCSGRLTLHGRTGVEPEQMNFSADDYTDEEVPNSIEALQRAIKLDQVRAHPPFVICPFTLPFAHSLCLGPCQVAASHQTQLLDQSQRWT